VLAFETVESIADRTRSIILSIQRILTILLIVCDLLIILTSRNEVQIHCIFCMQSKTLLHHIHGLNYTVLGLLKLPAIRGPQALRFPYLILSRHTPISVIIPKPLIFYLKTRLRIKCKQINTNNEK